MLETEYLHSRNPIPFSELSPNSHKLVWWRCDKGHEWQTPARKRLTNGHGCPYCSNKQTLTGYNDLATTHPDVAAQWHPTKNGELTPNQITAGSHKKAWFRIQNKDIHLSIRQAAKGYTPPPPITVTHPTLIAQWHPTKNGELTPDQITAGSDKQAWWVCNTCLHTWKTRVSARTKGTGCPACNGRTPTPQNNLTNHPILIAQWHPTKNGELTPNQITAGSSEQIWWRCDKGHEWQTRANDRTYYNSGCPTCNRRTSQSEARLREWLETTHNLKTLQHNRTVLKNREIDIYIPEKKMGIEYNGLYWHSEAAGKTKHYHEEKYLAAKHAGIQLIQIWEDDWNRDPDLVKRVLAHKLGVSNQPAVYARKTRVEALTTAMARGFLDANHVQGYASGSSYLGLRDIETQRLVAVIVLKKEPGHSGTLNIIRYATSTRVPGGFTKLLRFAEREYRPSRFITFADHCISDGALYEKNGFIPDKKLPPDYMYMINGKRVHKFGYRLKKFRNDPTLKWKEGLTEKELATLNGLYRVWDAGKTRYVKLVG